MSLNKRLINPGGGGGPVAVEYGEFTAFQQGASQANIVNLHLFTRTLSYNPLSKTANNLAWQFTTPAEPTEYTIEIRGGAGSYSPYNGTCGSQCAGYNAWTLNIIATIPASSNVVFYCGNRGDYGGNCTQEDCVAGGSGGATYIMYSDPSGPIAWNGTTYTPLAMGKGGQGGQDACFVYCYQSGAFSLTNVISSFVSVFGSNPANGTSFSLGGGQSYGGYPWGKGADDVADLGGGIHFYNPNATYVGNNGLPSAGQLGGFIKITGNFPAV